MEERRIQKDQFRDHLGTVGKEGGRIWIFPQKPKGRFYNYRTWFSYLLLGFFFSGPFITIGGQPLLLINILERKFIIFGVAFWPQDLHILVFGMLAFIIGVVVFTVIFGRVFCGWACPQTIFMEMVFRKIEYWIEGDYGAQKRLAKALWNMEKIIKKSSKHMIFFILAFLISNLFLAYVIGKDQLFDIITDPPSEHVGGLTAMFIFSGVFYGVFAYMREQVCHFVCPYGRMQSVMLDNNSINVMYDYKRGESRARVGDRKKVIAGKATLADLGFTENASFGDCIDCNQCVAVCPMGIDIRNGTQLECIHCTACVDACDAVMEKVDKPRGLIRYSTENSIKQGEHQVFTTRVMGYSAVLVIMMGIFMTLMFNRPDLETNIQRERGTLFQTLPGDVYSNIYQIQIINKAFQDKSFEIRLQSPQGELVPLGEITQIPSQEVTKGRFLVKLSKQQLDGLQTDLTFSVFADGEFVENIQSGFLGPANLNE